MLNAPSKALAKLVLSARLYKFNRQDGYHPASEIKQWLGQDTIGSEPFDR
jgi:hypothetical protein